MKAIIAHFTTLKTPEILFKTILFYFLFYWYCYIHGIICAFFIIKNKTIGEHIRKSNFKPRLSCYFFSWMH